VVWTTKEDAMAQCELLPTCLFFNDKMQNMPAVAGLYKQRYCQGDKMQCARYLVFSQLGRPAVPADLFPNEADRARQILAQA
jgi:hypothetical protein